MIELTEHQRQQISGPDAIFIDPNTKEQYVLLPKETYEKIKELLDDDARTMYPLLANLDSEDWEDASVYQS